MSDHWLHYLNLSDPYERKARFVPGLLAVLPVLPLAAAYRLSLGSWAVALVSGVGLAAAIAVLLSYLASAFGNRFQLALWPDWPHDSPTHRWLQPGNEEVSRQQRELWYEAIRALTGLDIAVAANQGTPDEVRRVINDAVAALRPRLSQGAEGERLRLHNTDFGFARNLTGLRVIWRPLTVSSSVGCWIGLVWFHCALVWALVSTGLVLVALPVGWYVLPGYVRVKAHQYAESFFSALMVLRATTAPVQH